jgi:hypothetical protein
MGEEVVYLKFDVQSFNGKQLVKYNIFLKENSKNSDQ